MAATAALRAWQVTTALLGVIATAVVALVLANAHLGVVPGRAGELRYAAQPSHYGRLAAHRITDIESGSPLAAAGIVAGDLIVDPPREALAAGQAVVLQVVHAGVSRSVAVRAAPLRAASAPLQSLLDLGLVVLSLTLGILICLRRWSSVDALVFAAPFFLGAVGLLPQAGADHRLAGAITLWVNACATIALPIVAYFPLVFEGGFGGRARVWLARACMALLLAGLTSTALLGPYFIGRIVVPPDGVLLPTRAILQLAGIGLCVLTYAAAWRHADGGRRERLRWLHIAFGILLANFLLMAAFAWGAFGTGGDAAFLANLISDGLGAVTILTTTYAIFRRRVIDLRFAINRAVVYAIFAAALLVGFALAEWLVEHFLRFEQREKSAWTDALIAVALYLGFHRARGWIEGLVERVFFHSWHEKETRLVRFLETAPHYSSAGALLEATLAAVDAFSEGRGSALYLRSQAGDFALLRATLARCPASLPRDDATVVEMKTFRAPAHLAVDHPWAGAGLALPLVRRADLVGVLLVGGRPGGEAFRPDEVENLARTARQIGTDLYALRLEQLEQDNADLRLRLAGLAARGDTSPVHVAAGDPQPPSAR